MSKFSVEARDTYLKLLEETSGDTVKIFLNEPESYPNKLSNILAWLPAEHPDGPWEQDNFKFEKNGDIATICAPHVYARFLNGERWNRAGVGGEPPTIEQLKEYHPNITEKFKFAGEPKKRGRPTKPVDPNAPPKEAKVRKAREPKTEGSPRKTKRTGPKPVEDDSGNTPNS